ncbi:nitroreductase [Alkaliphilus metalliredigens QYMF]|uniref:Nitroreductase n=1 Tax=Alkaliphilus metalliredigens (strain QYMF) TaxID=293826 RepID=A6TUI6_ALKMQ|nr:nitroreductase family protein [Alkaliphilus metalliredigens]ABR49854.1 nitroreductase [Alkaliphilus metalliredigens QYMF]
MKFKNLIEEMKTVRDFKEESVDNVLIQSIIKAGEETQGIVDDANVSILFIENGEKLHSELNGMAGYHGYLIPAPHYIAILSKKSSSYMENSGYLMESMRLKAWTLGLGTCWLSIEDPEELKNILKTDQDKVITSLIAIGYSYSGIFKTDLSPKTDRKNITDLVYVDSWGTPCNMEYLNARGMTNIFYYAKLAPSWGNKQPWRFIIDNEKVLLLLNEPQIENIYLDAGIMMLYFEKVAQEEGIPGKWNLQIEEGLELKYNIPKEYKAIAYFSL